MRLELEKIGLSLLAAWRPYEMSVCVCVRDRNVISDLMLIIKNKNNDSLYASDNKLAVVR